VLGLILGSAAVQAHTWQMRNSWQNSLRLAKLNAQHWRSEALRLQGELTAINRRSERRTYVQSVTLDVIKSPVPLIDVEAALDPYTESLLGAALTSIKLSLVYHLLDQRRLTLGGQAYRVEVKALLLSPDTVILLKLHPVAKSA
jgi:hypothetical protein